jgi:hypothetical protein
MPKRCRKRPLACCRAELDRIRQVVRRCGGQINAVVLGRECQWLLDLQVWHRLRCKWLYVARCTVLPLAEWGDLACAAQSVNCRSVESLPSVGYKWYGVGQNASRAV